MLLHGTAFRPCFMNSDGSRRHGTCQISPVEMILEAVPSRKR
jgi:hypothetical protein